MYIAHDHIHIAYACGMSRNYSRLSRTTTAEINAHEESNRLTVASIVKEWEHHAYGCDGPCYDYDPESNTHTVTPPTIKYVRQVTT